MKAERDAINLQYLRVVRGLAKAELADPTIPLTVYSSDYFPISFQFKEKRGEDKRINYSYNKVPMPKWNDLLIETKISLFQLFAEEWPKSLYAFHIKIDPEFRKGISDAALVAQMNKRVRSRLNSISDLAALHFFVVEAHSKKGEDVAPHLHGMVMVEDEDEAEAVRNAISKAAGQGFGGRPKLHKGSKGEFCYFEEGKSFPRYMLKHKDKGASRFGRKPFIFSQKANRFTRDLYEFATQG